jgi:hypothetical protein
MRERVDPSRRLLALAEAQHGVVSLEQAAATGLGRHSIARLIGDGHWQRLTGGLFFIGRQEPPWMALAWGGILLGGSSARLAGDAAGYFHSILPDPPVVIDVLTPHGRSRPGRDRWRFLQERDGVRARSVGHPPCTGAADTLLDLCDRRPAGDVIDLVITSVQAGQVDALLLRRRLSRRSRVKHRRLLEALLAEIVDGIESVLELDFARRVERPHGLPARTRQHVNNVAHRRDVRYDDYTTVVELDGRLAHEGRGRFRDMHRDNYAAVQGEVTLRYGFWDVYERPCVVARQIGAVLQLRGWVGQIITCPNCRQVPIADAFLP